MNAEPAGAESRPGTVERWLNFSVGGRASAVRLDCVVRVVDKIELFRVPLAPREFKGVIYFNERAVAVLNWEAFSVSAPLAGLTLILEQGKDWLAIEVAETGKVEEYHLGPESKAKGFWRELDSSRDIWGLDEFELFKAVRQDHSRPGRLGGKDGKEDIAGR